MKDYRVNINGIEVHARYSEQNIDEIFMPLLKKLTALYKKKQRRILAFLEAPPGAGKSTLAGFLETLSLQDPAFEDVQAVGMDGFHRRQEYLLTHTIFRDQKEIPMVDVKGTPETFDFVKLKNAVEGVLTEPVYGWPVYDRLLHNPIENAIRVEKNVVLLEGNYLLLDTDGWKGLADYADYTILIRAEEKKLRERLVERRIAAGHPAEDAGDFVDFSDMYNVRLCLSHAKEADLTLRLMDDDSYELF
ncbi:MAG: nucleoside/nucleotide kinase family protein [Lachnospiraceae bacterium]|nr:nucleoside/nucleotide kinase family protein [Lachnospiraceae bacterium]